MTKKEHGTDEKKTHEEKHDEDSAMRAQQEVVELTDTLKRLAAEFDNYKKRQDKENQILIKNANALLIKNLLTVLDSFELAIKNSNTDTPEIEKFKKGMEMIYAQLFGILKEQGLRIIETKDRKFDPYKHEVLMVKESDADDDVILQELQKGYMLNDIVLRHSKVMISRKKEDDKNG